MATHFRLSCNDLKFRWKIEPIRKEEEKLKVIIKGEENALQRLIAQRDSDGSCTSSDAAKSTVEYDKNPAKVEENRQETVLRLRCERRRKKLADLHDKKLEILWDFVKEWLKLEIDRLSVETCLKNNSSVARLAKYYMKFPREIVEEEDSWRKTEKIMASNEFHFRENNKKSEDPKIGYDGRIAGGYGDQICISADDQMQDKIDARDELTKETAVANNDDNASVANEAITKTKSAEDQSEKVIEISHGLDMPNHTDLSTDAHQTVPAISDVFLRIEKSGFPIQETASAVFTQGEANTLSVMDPDWRKQYLNRVASCDCPWEKSNGERADWEFARRLQLQLDHDEVAKQPTKAFFDEAHEMSENGLDCPDETEGSIVETLAHTIAEQPQVPISSDKAQCSETTTAAVSSAVTTYTTCSQFRSRRGRGGYTKQQQKSPRFSKNRPDKSRKPSEYPPKASKAGAVKSYAKALTEPKPTSSAQPKLPWQPKPMDESIAENSTLVWPREKRRLVTNGVPEIPEPTESNATKSTEKLPDSRVQEASKVISESEAAETLIKRTLAVGSTNFTTAKSREKLKDDLVEDKKGSNVHGKKSALNEPQSKTDPIRTRKSNESGGCETKCRKTKGRLHKSKTFIKSKPASQFSTDSTMTRENTTRRFVTQAKPKGNEMRYNGHQTKKQEDSRKQKPVTATNNSSGDHKHETTKTHEDQTGAVANSDQGNDGVDTDREAGNRTRIAGSEILKAVNGITKSEAEPEESIHIPPLDLSGLSNTSQEAKSSVSTVVNLVGDTYDSSIVLGDSFEQCKNEDQSSNLDVFKTREEKDSEKPVKPDVPFNARVDAEKPDACKSSFFDFFFHGRPTECQPMNGFYNLDQAMKDKCELGDIRQAPVFKPFENSWLGGLPGTSSIWCPDRTVRSQFLEPQQNYFTNGCAPAQQQWRSNEAAANYLKRMLRIPNDGQTRHESSQTLPTGTDLAEKSYIACESSGFMDNASNESMQASEQLFSRTPCNRKARGDPCVPCNQSTQLGENACISQCSTKLCTLMQNQYLPPVDSEQQQNDNSAAYQMEVCQRLQTSDSNETANSFFPSSSVFESSFGI